MAARVRAGGLSVLAESERAAGDAMAAMVGVASAAWRGEGTGSAVTARAGEAGTARAGEDGTAGTARAGLTAKAETGLGDGGVMAAAAWWQVMLTLSVVQVSSS